LDLNRTALAVGLHLRDRVAGLVLCEDGLALVIPDATLVRLTALGVHRRLGGLLEDRLHVVRARSLSRGEHLRSPILAHSLTDVGPTRVRVEVEATSHRLTLEAVAVDRLAVIAHLTHLTVRDVGDAAGQLLAAAEGHLDHRGARIGDLIGLRLQVHHRRILGRGLPYGGLLGPVRAVGLTRGLRRCLLALVLLGWSVCSHGNAPFVLPRCDVAPAGAPLWAPCDRFASSTVTQNTAKSETMLSDSMA